MNSHFSFIILAGVVIGGISGVLVVVNNPARAQRSASDLATIMVNTLDDELNSDGDCSLREAVSAANTNLATDACPAGNSSSTDTVNFGVSGIILLSTQLDIETVGGPLMIDGGGVITLSGGNIVRIFNVKNGTSLTVENLIITDGNANYGGGIANAGNLTVIESILADNTAVTNGGGIYNQVSAMTTIISSTLSGNSAISGGGIYNGFLLYINSSTLSGNNAQDGGGIYNDGSAWLTNCTVSGNSASSRGGGVYNSVTTSNCTISNNHAGLEGGGIFSAGSISMRNTILAGNLSDTIGPDCIGQISTYGYNLVGNTQDCGAYPFREGDLSNIDARLGPLHDNGGPTQTLALLSGSLAIDHGNPEGCKNAADSPLPIDQRGFARSGRCDIGAYEWQPAPFGTNTLFLPAAFNSCAPPLYYDDFSNPASGWPVGENENVQYEYLSNEYRISVKSLNTMALASPGLQASDYVAMVDVRSAGATDDTSYGIVFGTSEDLSQFYTFEVQRYGTYRIYRYLIQPDFKETILASGTTDGVHPVAETNQLKIVRMGDQMRAYANGELLNIINDANSTGLRYIGLVAKSYANPEVDIRFDNFTVYPISCGSSNVSLGFDRGLLAMKVFEIRPENK